MGQSLGRLFCNLNDNKAPKCTLKKFNKNEQNTIKLSVSPTHSLILPAHPPTVVTHMMILVPDVESYLEGFMCEAACAKSV